MQVVKQQTLEKIEEIIQQSSIPGNPNKAHKAISVTDRNIILNITGNIDQESIKAIQKTIQDDGFFKSFQIYVNGKEIKINSLSDEIKENNSKRVKIITHDEITNFKILINSPITWEQFMEII